MYYAKVRRQRVLFFLCGMCLFYLIFLIMQLKERDSLCGVFCLFVFLTAE